MNDQYWYDLPERLIAQVPANPRDSSKLLIYNTKNNQLIIDEFKNLTTSLPPSTTLTLNDAEVVPARVSLTKETGGKIIILFLVNEWIMAPNGPIPCLLDRKAEVGGMLFFPDKSFVTVQRKDKGIFFVSWSGNERQFIQKLNEYGTMPIPPYIKHSPLSRDELRKKYQTIFAKKIGSSAAPTASLHFTPEVFARLKAAGIKKQYITLHVGLGTFAPLTKENMRLKTLHKEWYELTGDVFRYIDKSKSKKNDITAVGTTVVRTLESAALVLKSEKTSLSKSDAPLEPPYNKNSLSGATDLFIYPPFKFKVVDHLITNFHLPGSSLMMLVDAFLAHKKAPKRILELYEFAIKNEFRFYSFGDAMLIL